MAAGSGSTAVAPRNLSAAKINDFGFVQTSGNVSASACIYWASTAHFDAMARLFVFVISFIVQVLRTVIRSCANRVIENLVLRQYVATLCHLKIQADTDANWNQLSPIPFAICPVQIKASERSTYSALSLYE